MEELMERFQRKYPFIKMAYSTPSVYIDAIYD
jgi:hypothetical protein